MDSLLTLAALIEAATGLALMAMPAVVVRMLLGAEIEGASVSLGRVAGVALLALALACWPVRDPTRSATPAFRAMLFYNAMVSLYLLYLGIQGDWVGPMLWPAALLHGALAVLLARRGMTLSRIH